MKLERIINSLLETDLYKFSMGQAIYHQFPGYKTTWTFKCRNEDVHFTEEKTISDNSGFTNHGIYVILPPVVIKCPLPGGK